MKEKNIKWITTAAFVLALCLMIVGIKNGEVSVVLTKATSICLQCIGVN